MFQGWQRWEEIPMRFFKRAFWHGDHKAQRQWNDRKYSALLSLLLALNEICCPEPRKTRGQLLALGWDEDSFKCLFAFLKAVRGQNAPVLRGSCLIAMLGLDVLVTCLQGIKYAFSLHYQHNQNRCFWPTQLCGFYLIQTLALYH